MSVKDYYKLDVCISAFIPSLALLLFHSLLCLLSEKPDVVLHEASLRGEALV